MNEKSWVQFIKERPLKPIILLCLVITLLVIPFVLPYNKGLVESIKVFEGDLIQPLRIIGSLFGIIGIVVNTVKMKIAKDVVERKKAFNIALILAILLVILFYIPAMISA
ncbi:hypothetical protein U0X36_25775 [Bacillus thuringiensis]|uniref:hypothetical protein n=1 Tax=Bacillus thuringiensis TaxID=1428 RepID=UPI000E51D722|nr:hypothetical protein [Bacillus thuringiensis]MDZ3956223.1 hypothetical protein [Bacillus thuringiensis]RGP42394.1 hypothetical protein BTW32_30970 [Bacillus thuringiensis]